MAWLRHGVPVTLLVDLLEPDGPRSREIYTAEAVADDVRRDAHALGAATQDLRQHPASGKAGQDFSAERTA